MYLKNILKSYMKSRGTTKLANEFQWFLNSAVCDSCLQWACSSHMTTLSISPQLWRQRSFQIMNANLCYREAPDWRKFSAKGQKNHTASHFISRFDEVTWRFRIGLPVSARWLACRRPQAFPGGRHWQSSAGLQHWGGGWPGRSTQHDSRSWGTPWVPQGYPRGTSNQGPWFDVRFHYIFQIH